MHKIPHYDFINEWQQSQHWVGLLLRLQTASQSGWVINYGGGHGGINSCYFQRKQRKIDCLKSCYRMTWLRNVTPTESSNPNFQTSQLYVANTYSLLMLEAQHDHVTTALCHQG